MAATTVGIVVQSVGDEGDARETYRSISAQQLSGSKTSIVVWCTNCSSQYADLHRGNNGVHVVQSDITFLSDLRSSLSVIKHCEWICLCHSGVIFQSNCVQRILAKALEYGGESSLTLAGVRLFPHETLRLGGNFREGLHWKLYDHTREDRAVHCLTTDFCCFNVNVLKRIAALEVKPFPENEDVWVSFVIGHYLKLPIWKIKCEQVGNIHPRFKPIPPLLYAQICESDWPRNICNPYYSSIKLDEVRKSSSISPALLWEQGFGGVNMSAEPASELDFAAAASYGVRVIRLGAVCDANDLSYLLDPSSNGNHDDKKHLLSAIPRLKQGIQKSHACGLKVILTMTDLPGSSFHSPKGSLLSFWKSPACRVRAAQFWGVLSECLVDIKHMIMGYDLINEPYTPEDENVNYFEKMSNAYKEELSHFYKITLEEIRKHDRDTMVIIKSTWFANPKAINMLTPLPDPNVVYSVHVYIPPQVTFPRKFRDHEISYPGPVSKWKLYTHDKVVIDFQYLHKLLSETVHKWQLRHSVPSNRILVAEFGICREVSGGQQYLTDLLSIFTEFGWSWLLFSFRDEEWDAMDYELGPDVSNMLDRTANDLLLCVADQFH